MVITQHIFDSFGVQYIPRENEKFIGNKNMMNIYRRQVYDSVIEFIDFMLNNKRFERFGKFFFLRAVL